ncbi:Transposase, MuDR, MULE transposase domain protein [Melia azedarach]|uniref:Transposase, MuDR, MULE transposase domain protein n=1 Tax=Melia azedarach TaxID=155640 RepID=A0ACC1YI77_MELAZ|nr:Transposase, MuDR, MULE transposase domain protein [Melia azedarach]
MSANSPYMASRRGYCPLYITLDCVNSADETRVEAPIHVSPRTIPAMPTQFMSYSGSNQVNDTVPAVTTQSLCNSRFEYTGQGFADRYSQHSQLPSIPPELQHRPVNFFDDATTIEGGDSPSHNNVAQQNDYHDTEVNINGADISQPCEFGQNIVEEESESREDGCNRAAQRSCSTAVPSSRNQFIRWLPPVAPSARAHFPSRQYDLLTTNIAESMNSLLRHARSLPIIPLVDYTRSHVQRWFYERREQATAKDAILTPAAQAIIDKQLELSRPMTVEPVSRNEFERASSSCLTTLLLNLALPLRPSKRGVSDSMLSPAQRVSGSCPNLEVSSLLFGV